MLYSIKKLDYTIVVNLLYNCENSFNPPLSHNIPFTVDEYAMRLANNASFVVCEENGEIIGFTAFYTNIPGGFVYIPQIWVSDDYQRKGIGAKMMDVLIQCAPKDIQSIRLEVRRNNEKAFSFYAKNGFSCIGDSNNKCLLERILKR
jgi:ribosomal protein S18 acetylase RimI-like enzyme